MAKKKRIKSGDKLLVGMLVFLCLLITGLGIGVSVTVLMKTMNKGMTLADCEERIDTMKKDQELTGVVLDEAIDLFQTCIDLASESEKTALYVERANYVSSNDIDDKYGELVVGDLIEVDKKLQSVSSAVAVANMAESYELIEVAKEYQQKMIERMSLEGIDYYEGASG